MHTFFFLSLELRVHAPGWSSLEPMLGCDGAPVRGDGARVTPVVRVRGRVLTDKRRIHLRSASVRTYTFFTTGFPRFLSIRGARGLQAFDLLLLTNYSNPIYG
jgi:hypothetical protein